MKKVFEYVDLVARFHALVMSRTTGNPDAFACKLGISRSSLYNLIQEIESSGIEIAYSRAWQTFMYVYPERVEITLTICQHETNE